MINYISANANVLPGQNLNVIRDTSGDITVLLFSPGGFFGAPEVQFINISEDSATITPVSGTIGGGASYQLAPQQSVSFIPNGIFGTDGIWLAVSGLNPDISGNLVIQAGQSLTYSSTPYDGDGSFQPIGPDLNLDADAGVDDPDTAYLAPIMGNVIAETPLTKDANTIAGLIGKLSITGTRASTYPVAAVVAEVGDGVSEADGAFVAVIGGDSGLTNARAAFTVDNQNSTPGSGLDYGVDLKGNDHNGYGPVAYLQGDIRFSDGTVQSTAGGNSYEIPTGVVDGVNDEFTFTAPPILVFRNGVMERRLGSVGGNVFTFDTPPLIGDDIEGLV